MQESNKKAAKSTGDIIVEPRTEQPKEKLVAEYKKIFQQLINMRPSGTRNKIAEALGKNKSFVSQITNPVYSVPIPAKHLEIIFNICHFSIKERETFLKQYTIAHPNYQYRIKSEVVNSDRHTKLILNVPLLDNPDDQQKTETLIRDFAEQIFSLMKSKGK